MYFVLDLYSSDAVPYKNFAKLWLYGPIQTFLFNIQHVKGKAL